MFEKVSLILLAITAIENAIGAFIGKKNAKQCTFGIEIFLSMCYNVNCIGVYNWRETSRRSLHTEVAKKFLKIFLI